MTQRIQADRTRDYIQQEQLLAHERALTKIDSAKILVQEAQSINQLCEDLKRKLIKFDTGLEIIPTSADEGKILLSESLASDFIGHGTEMGTEVEKLRASLSEYNHRFIKVFIYKSYCTEHRTVRRSIVSPCCHTASAF